MSLSPVAFIAPNYRDFKGDWIKFYEPGTTTAKIIYLDAGGVASSAKLQIDADGFISSSGGAIVAPYIIGAYDAYIFGTEADADANSTISATRIADNISGLLSQSAKIFDNIAEMKADTSLVADDYVICKRYYSGGDLVDGLNFKVVTGGSGVDDGGSFHDNVNGTQSQLIIKNDTVFSKQFGSQDDSDITLSVNNAINNTTAKNIVITDERAFLNRITLSRGSIKISAQFEIKKLVQNPLNISDRAFFMADGLSDIEIDLNADLQAEGSRSIGQAGLILNEYNTVAGRTGVSGPANAVFFGVRCSYIKLRGNARNSGETGYLLRNCANIDADVTCTNICGSGVELSFPALDGSSSVQPVRENYKVICRAEHINDLKLGAGNGTAVSMAGSAGSSEVFRNFDITVYGNKNSREIHQEFNGGARIENFRHTLFSRNALQGGIVTMGRNGIIRGEVINAGCAGSGAVNTGYPSMYGYLASSGSDDIDCKLTVVSTISDGFTVVSDGSISSGSNTLTSVTANFPANIVGQHVCIEGANPNNTPLEAYVTTRTSATEVTLDLQAQASVTGATIGYGSGLRNPLSMNGLGACSFDGSVVRGGVFSNLPSEPASAGIVFNSGNKQSSARNIILQAPSLVAGASSPSGLKVSASFANKIIEDGSLISGFTENYDGWASNLTASTFKINRKVVQDAIPSATIDTYGTALTFTPRRQSFEYIFRSSLEFDGLDAETLSAQLEFFFIDGGSNTLDLISSTNQISDLTTPQLATIHRDNQKITSFTVKVKSSKASSTARARLSYLAVEG